MRSHRVCRHRSLGLRCGLMMIALMMGPRVLLGGETIRVGALAYGTLAWEIAALPQAPESNPSFQIDLETLAGPEAGRIALLGGAVDLIVTDWIWVADQRLKGEDFTFVPFSGLHGALVVPSQSSIRSLADLPGKRLGIAGGALDKNWQLLREAARRTAQLDLEQAATLTFAAPPLLSETLKQGRLDAILTYWNQAALLEAQGYRRVLDGPRLEALLGLETLPPTLGYVFRERWANTHEPALRGFLAATQEARRALCQEDRRWKAIHREIQAPNEEARTALRAAYCAQPTPKIQQDQLAAARTLYGWLDRGGAKGQTLPSGVFYRIPPGEGP